MTALRIAFCCGAHVGEDAMLGKSGVIAGR